MKFESDPVPFDVMTRPDDILSNSKYKTQVTSHCFTNTESILNIHKS